MEHDQLHSVEAGRAVIFPNPVTIGGSIDVHLAADISADASIGIYNLLGERIMTIDNPVRGNNRVEIDESVFAHSGFIMVEVQNQSSTQTLLVSVVK